MRLNLLFVTVRRYMFDRIRNAMLRAMDIHEEAYAHSLRECDAVSGGACVCLCCKFVLWFASDFFKSLCLVCKHKQNNFYESLSSAVQHVFSSSADMLMH